MAAITICRNFGAPKNKATVSPSISHEVMGKQWKQWLTLFLGGSKIMQMVIAAMKLKDAYSLKGKL